MCVVWKYTTKAVEMVFVSTFGGKIVKGFFEGNLEFLHLEQRLPSADEVLQSKECSWKLDSYNASYLAGKTAEPTHQLVELSRESVFGGGSTVTLAEGWTEADTRKVIGDTSHQLTTVLADIIIARTSDFRMAEEMAVKMGYEAARLGEFLQLAWYTFNARNWHDSSGWYFCYAGRTPRYATLANMSLRSKTVNVTFDTSIGDDLEDGHISANEDTHCFFVRRG